MSDISSLTSLESLGFTGGRDSFHAFCARIFADDTHRLLRTEAGELVVFRHGDLRAFGALPEVGALPPGVMFPGLHLLPDGAAPPPGSGIGGVISHQVFTANPPVHMPVRMTLLRQLNPKQAALLEPVAREVVRELLAAAETRPEIDFVEDIAEPLTAHFWGRLIGMTDTEMAEAIAAVRGMTAMFLIQMTREDLHLADTSTAAYGRLVETAALRSLSQGAHPFVSELAADLARVDASDDPEEAGIVPPNVGKLLAGNLVEGFHTAAVGAVNTLYALLQNPAAYADVLAAPEKLPAAIMEALRIEPPVVFLKRYILRDTDYAGVSIPKGTLVVMLWAAGNHDPSVFPDPATFRLDRDHRGITTFGGGAHICPGRHVAMMLTRILLEEIAARGLAFSFTDGPYDWLGNHAMSQLPHMRLRVEQPQAA